MAEDQREFDILTKKIQAQGDLVRKLKAAKEPSEKGKGNMNLNLNELDTYLSQYSYVNGYIPSKYDDVLSKRLNDDSSAKTYCYIRRWLYHMQSFSESEIKQFPATTPNAFKVENAVDSNEKV